MAQKADEDLLKTLCEQAANEQDSKRLMELVKAITTLLDAKKQKQPASRMPRSD
jgi:hypothetical protein